MAVAPGSSKSIQDARNVRQSDPAKAEAIYKEILSKGAGSTDAALREYEAALVGLGELYRDTKKANELAELVRTSQSALSSFAKAKTAKLGMLLLFLSYNILLTSGSPPASRSLLRHSQYCRHTNFRHKVLYRTGCL